MPRYFFHVHDSHDVIDAEGSHLEGPEAARAEAVTAAGEMIRDLGGRFWSGSDWSMRVVDEDDRTICTLRLSGSTGDV